MEFDFDLLDEVVETRIVKRPRVRGRDYKQTQYTTAR